MKPLHILALNSGSSSLKFGLYRADGSGAQKLFGDALAAEADLDAMPRVAAALAAASLPAPDAIGHRVVHGGPAMLQHRRIDETVLQQLQAAAVFAPLHTPATLALVRAAQRHFPGLPQVACFDTQFHAGLPEVARVLSLPRELLQQGVQRYGFHGLSLESIVRQLGSHLPDRLVVAHLGSGASVTALKAGRSVDTSMGLTPSGGVIMASRSGDLDPGVLVYLLRELHLDAAALESLIDHQSGLLGISGLSGDLRRLHEAAASRPEARLAIEMFCMSVRKQVAAMAAVLGGLDLLVFTGGIGENDVQVRDAVCRGLAWMGVGDGGGDAGSNGGAAARRRVLVLPSQEDEQIARHTWAALAWCRSRPAAAAHEAARANAHHPPGVRPD